jgi:hypothetical protein
VSSCCLHDGNTKKKFDNFFAIKGRCFLKNPFYDSLAHNLGRKKRIFAPKKKNTGGNLEQERKAAEPRGIALAVHSAVIGFGSRAWNTGSAASSRRRSGDGGQARPPFVSLLFFPSLKTRS